MQRRTHQLSGVAVFFAAVTLYPPADSWVAGLYLLAAYFGSTAPDDLEVAWWSGARRYSLIPHRSITHWLLPWMAALAWLVLDASNGGVARAALGCYVAGGLVHVLLDSTTPASIPVLLPWRIR